MAITDITCPSCQRPVDGSTTKCVYDGTPLNCINTDPGLRLRYDRLEEMAGGGMGVIYKAYDNVRNQMVAIKTMHLHVMTLRTIERFKMEAKATAKLSHANIIAIHEHGITASGQPFLVMDYLQGETLSELIKREVTLDLSSFYSVFSQACQGLSHAHSRSILHRDIKPSNIMIERNQKGELHVSILDFGIARLLDDDDYEAQKMTKTGDVIGSPAYMSPEQARGAKVDHRSDVYSLGCVMYEALTGVPPFFGKTALETMLMHKADVALPMSEASLGKKVDPELEKAVFHLLEKNPDDRYQSMSEIDDDLLLLRTGRSIQKAPTDSPKAGWGKKAKIAIVMACAIAVGGTIFVAYKHNLWQPQAAPGVVQPTTLLNNDLSFDRRLPRTGAQKLLQHSLKSRNPYADLTFATEAVTNQDIAQIKGATFVTHFLVNHGLIDDDGLQVISDLPLVELRLRFTKVKNLSALKQMKTLTQLDLQDSPIDSSGMQVISNLHKLEDLFLSGTPIHDQDLKCLYALTSLHSIELSNCPNITQPALQQLQKKLGQCDVTSESDEHTASAHYDQELGIALEKQGQYEQAAAAYQKAIALLRADPNPNLVTNPLDIFYDLCSLGDCQANLHRYKQGTDSYRRGLNWLLERVRQRSGDERKIPGACAHLAGLYEKWNLASASQASCKMAASFRVQSEKAANSVESNSQTMEARLTNLSALAYDYVLLKDYQKAVQTYKQFSDFGWRITLLEKMNDALDYEAHPSKTSLANAIALRQAAEVIFQKPESVQNAGYRLLHAQNSERLGSDLIPINAYDQALPLMDQAAIAFAKGNVVLSGDFLDNLEKTADYFRGKNPEKSLSLYKTVETAYSDVGRTADATRLHKKITLLAHVN